MISSLFPNFDHKSSTRRSKLQAKNNNRKATRKLLHLAQQNKWDSFTKRCKSHPEDASFYDKKKDPELHQGYVLHHILCRGEKDERSMFYQNYMKRKKNYHSKVPLEAIRAVIDAYPSALYHKNNFDRGLLFLIKQNNNWDVNVLEMIIKKYMPPSIDELQKCLSLPRELIQNYVLPYLPNMALDQDKIGHTALHSMIIQKVGYDYIHTLLKLLPELATIPSTSMRTPLHIACYCDADIKVVNTIHRAYPRAIEMKDRTGIKPTQALRINCFLER